MSAVATLVRDGLVERVRARVQQLFSGLTYATVVAFVMYLSWALQDIAPQAPTLSAASALQRIGPSILDSFRASYPNVLLLVAMTNVAPRGGARRYLWLLATSMLMAFYCSFDWGTWQLPLADPRDFIYSTLQALMITLVCAYRSSARTAESDLARDRAQAAVLESEATRARLQLLRAQIEPHFLFNTLATVRALVRSDKGAAVDMIANLIRYLSEALPRLREDESSLADELQLVEAYLRIHQIRMGSRLTFELPPATGLETVRVPTMLLLTLVENALKHGINPSVEGGSIRISAQRGESAVVIKVADTGRGLAASEGHGVGLANIRRRLSMLYGDRALLSLSGATTRGMVATVSIPIPATS